jgi:signal transduction histidine kinase
VRPFARGGSRTRLPRDAVQLRGQHEPPRGADLAEFRRTLRHDLRTPINAIKGYGEMLREDAADGSAETFVADLNHMHLIDPKTDQVL